MAKNRLARVLLTSLIPIGLVLFFMFWAGFLTPWDSALSDKNLLGLTPIQVVSKLGKPIIDAQTEGWPTTDPSGSGYWMAYNRHWQTFKIVFGNGKVVRIDRSEK
jgi:hypothetical protein